MQKFKKSFCGSFGYSPDYPQIWCFHRPNIKLFMLMCENSHYYGEEVFVVSDFFSHFTKYFWQTNSCVTLRIDSAIILWRQSCKMTSFWEITGDHSSWSATCSHNLRSTDDYFRPNIHSFMIHHVLINVFWTIVLGYFAHFFFQSVIGNLSSFFGGDFKIMQDPSWINLFYH